jgi:uncharacterized protein YecE (DUF72 family)
MQLPASFRFTAENREYLIRLRRTFSEFPLVAELRHSSWSLDEATGVLVDYHVGMANLDQPANSTALEPASRLTSSIGFCKLFGPGPIPGHFEFDDTAAAPAAPFLFSVPELDAWAKRINYIRRFAREVYVVFANAPAGCSLTNALQIESLLDQPQIAPYMASAPPVHRGRAA